MKIVNITHSTLPVADDILCSAFESNCSMMADMDRLLRIEPEGFIMGYYKDRPAGTGGAVRYGPFAYLGMMAVTKQAQHRGIGRGILDEILKSLDDQSVPVVLLDATLAGKPLYQRAGFEVDDQVRQFVRRIETPLPPASPFVRSFSLEDLPAVVDFDQPIFGARRDQVLKEFLRDFPDRGFVFEDQDGVSGFLIAQEQRIGPWTASTEEAAQALLMAALRLPFGEPPKVLIPTSNQAGATMLVRHGFVLQTSLDHMRRGGAANPIQRQNIFGLASFALG
jgi:GNAT superfamily N-acetyltransferase